MMEDAPQDPDSQISRRTRKSTSKSKHENKAMVIAATMKVAVATDVRLIMSKVLN